MLNNLHPRDEKIIKSRLQENEKNYNENPFFAETLEVEDIL